MTVEGDTISLGNGKIKVSAERDPTKLPWKDLGVDIAMECTGIFNAKDKASAHLTAGAKRVLVSAPADHADATIVFGVNHDTLTKDHIVVSNGSCTTNCLAPVAKVLNDTVGIETGFMTTIHAYTGDQPTLDTLHKDLYRARAAAMSMIPTSTGAAKAIGLVLPELKGKLDGVSIRVPTPNVSVIDLKIVAKRATEPKEINEAMKRASEQQLKGILGYTTAPNVSIDFNHDPHSSIFHMDQTKVHERHTSCGCCPGTTTNGVSRTAWATPRSRWGNCSKERHDASCLDRHSRRDFADRACRVRLRQGAQVTTRQKEIRRNVTTPDRKSWHENIPHPR